MISAWLGSWFGQLALLIHKTSSPGKLLIFCEGVYKYVKQGFAHNDVLS